MSTPTSRRLGVPILKSVSLLVLILLFGHFILHNHLFHLHISHHTPHGARTEVARTELGETTIREAQVTTTSISQSSQPSLSNDKPNISTPPPSPPPSPPPKHVPVWRDHLPDPPASIMLTFGSKSVADFIMNWYEQIFDFLTDIPLEWMPAFMFNVYLAYRILRAGSLLASTFPSTGLGLFATPP